MIEHRTLVRVVDLDVGGRRVASVMGLRLRLGREPTAEDIGAEMAAERERHPLIVVTAPPAPRIDL